MKGIFSEDAVGGNQAHAFDDALRREKPAE